MSTVARPGAVAAKRSRHAAAARRGRPVEPEQGQQPARGQAGGCGRPGRPGGAGGAGGAIGTRGSGGPGRAGGSRRAIGPGRSSHRPAGPEHVHGARYGVAPRGAGDDRVTHDIQRPAESSGRRRVASSQLLSFGSRGPPPGRLVEHVGGALLRVAIGTARSRCADDDPVARDRHRPSEMVGRHPVGRGQLRSCHVRAPPALGRLDEHVGRAGAVGRAAVVAEGADNDRVARDRHRAAERILRCPVGRDQLRGLGHGRAHRPAGLGLLEHVDGASEVGDTQGAGDNGVARNRHRDAKKVGLRVVGGRQLRGLGRVHPAAIRGLLVDVNGATWMGALDGACVDGVVRYRHRDPEQVAGGITGCGQLRDFGPVGLSGEFLGFTNTYAEPSGTRAPRAAPTTTVSPEMATDEPRVSSGLMSVEVSFALSNAFAQPFAGLTNT